MTDPPIPFRAPSKLPSLLRAMPNASGTSPNGTEPAFPTIDTGDKDLPRISAAALSALIAANDPPHLFWYGGMLARLDRNEDDVPVLRPFNEDRCRHALARSARYIRYDKDGNVHDALPPAYVVKDLLASPTLELPALTRIVEVPVYAADGTLNQTPGYHEAGRSYYAPTAGFCLPTIPEHPSAKQIDNARRFIVDDLMGGFPFIGPAEIANAVALFLDPFVRDMIDGPTPLRIIDAPTAGSGKGLLASVLLMSAIGREPSVIAPANDDDEWRKRLFAALRTSPSAILIDNITGALVSGTLALALTALWFEDRVLGASEMVRLPVRCAWVATSNNATMSTDIARRSVRIRLDAKMDRPWQRTGFDHENLRGWAHENRVKLVWYGLVLVRHWLAEGAPLGTTTLGSYERWAAVLGGILGAAGVDDFLGNLEELYETADTEGAMLRSFVAAWYEKYGEAEVGVGELFEVASNVEGFELGKGNDRAQRTSFGRRLTKMRDRVVGDYRIVHTRVVHQAKKFRLGKSKPAEQKTEMGTSGNLWGDKNEDL